ncbi:MAG: efflux RND transporter periplasmic adaptor subunit [Cyclobacteriaceae bacterium]|nr:efflux RND transporter periplasmic adaptor subunit [Cyclobacteriaceae bacterium]
MQNNHYLHAFLSALAFSCTQSDSEFDATGNFEADEIIISAEASGKILRLDIEEGSELKSKSIIGLIDTTQLYLKKKQLEYSIRAVNAKQPNSTIQLAAIQEQIENAKREKKRVENLLKDDAATQKQLDDLNAQLDLLQRQHEATQSTLNITKQSLQSETLPLQAQLEQIQDQIKKSQIINPINGTVLTLYAKQNEVVNPGKALYKIADLSTVILRAYISGNQLSEIKLGQTVTVLVDAANDDYKKYTGTINWVSDKAEFTPKTIQTKEERANLVYAIKIDVKNDGYLKLGMYGEVKFN